MEDKCFEPRTWHRPKPTVFSSQRDLPSFDFMYATKGFLQIAEVPIESRKRDTISPIRQRNTSIVIREFVGLFSRRSPGAAMNFPDKLLMSKTWPSLETVLRKPDSTTVLKWGPEGLKAPQLNIMRSSIRDALCRALSGLPSIFLGGLSPSHHWSMSSAAFSIERGQLSSLGSLKGLQCGQNKLQCSLAE